MAQLRPFRALRPRPEHAAAVAAVPYDVVDANEARALVDGAPLSFLRVGRAEVELPRDADPYGAPVYRRAAENLARLRRDGVLVDETEPSLYVYRLRMGDRTQVGVAGCFSVDEYEGDAIRKHERTRQAKEDDRTRHILATGAQTGPVFLIHRAAPAVDAVVARVLARPPLLSLTAADGIGHEVWRAEPAERDGLVAAFAAIPALYIADGHHRAASAMRARAELRAAAGGGPVEADGFLAVAFPEEQLRILPYHRVVADLAGATPDGLLEALRERLEVRAGSEVPAGPGEVAVYLDRAWYAIRLAPAAVGASPSERLDVARLHDQVLAPLLGIGDERTDPRIDFIGGIRGPGALVERVDRGGAAVAFAMHPVSVAELIAISDAGGIMPPKSTWFEPKLRDGLLTHVIAAPGDRLGAVGDPAQEGARG